jgi:hypothetical protein
MNAEHVDTRDGINFFLDSLDRLRVLFRYREEYAKKREELLKVADSLPTQRQRRGERKEVNGRFPKLHKWIILNGRIQLRDDGKIALPMCDGVYLRRPNFDLPVVMRSGDYTRNSRGIEFNVVPHQFIPPEDAICQKCHGKWKISNCCEIVARYVFRQVHLGEFAGRSYLNAISTLERRNKALYFNHFLGNLKGEELHLHPDDYLPPGVVGMFDIIWFLHPKCSDRRLGMNSLRKNSSSVIRI